MKPRRPYNIICSCGCSRGVVYVDTPNRGPWGFLLCPRCDWSEPFGPPPSLENRMKDVRPES